MINVEVDRINNAIVVRFCVDCTERNRITEQIVNKVSRYQEISHEFPSFFPKILEVNKLPESLCVRFNSFQNKVSLSELLRLPEEMRNCKHNEIISLIKSLYAFDIKYKVKTIGEDLIFAHSIEDVFNYLIDEDNEYHKVGFESAISFYMLFIRRIYQLYGFIQSFRFFLTRYFLGISFKAAFPILSVGYLKLFLSFHSLRVHTRYALFFLASFFIFSFHYLLHNSYVNKYSDRISYLSNLIEKNDAYISGRISSTDVLDDLEDKLSVLEVNSSASSYLRLKLAHVYFNKRDLKRVIDLLQPLSYVKNDSSSLEASYLKAFAYYQIGALSSAESIYRNIFSVGFGGAEFIRKNQTLIAKTSTSFALLLYELGDTKTSTNLVKLVFPDIKKTLLDKLDKVSSFELRRLTSSLSDVCLIFVYMADTRSSECTNLLLSIPSPHVQQKLFNELLRTYSLLIDGNLKLIESVWRVSQSDVDFYSTRHLDQAILLSNLLSSHDIKVEALNKIIETALAKSDNKIFLTNTTLYLKLAKPERFDCDLISQRYKAVSTSAEKDPDNVRVINAWLSNNFMEITDRCFKLK